MFKKTRTSNVVNVEELRGELDRVLKRGKAAPHVAEWFHSTFMKYMLTRPRRLSILVTERQLSPVFFDLGLGFLLAHSTSYGKELAARYYKAKFADLPTWAQMAVEKGQDRVRQAERVHASRRRRQHHCGAIVEAVQHSARPYAKRGGEQVGRGVVERVIP